MNIYKQCPDTVTHIYAYLTHIHTYIQIHHIDIYVKYLYLYIYATEEKIPI